MARTREIVVPYLKATYPLETQALCGWIEEHGGVRLSFADLAGDPRTTARGDNRRTGAVSHMETALELLVERVQQGASLQASRLGFAQELLWQERHADALTIVHPGPHGGPG